MYNLKEYFERLVTQGTKKEIDYFNSILDYLTHYKKVEYITNDYLLIQSEEWCVPINEKNEYSWGLSEN